MNAKEGCDSRITLIKATLLSQNLQVAKSTVPER